MLLALLISLNKKLTYGGSKVLSTFISPARYYNTHFDQKKVRIFSWKFCLSSLLLNKCFFDISDIAQIGPEALLPESYRDWNPAAALIQV